MELTIQEIERAIDALPPHELAEGLSWLDVHRPTAVANKQSLSGEASGGGGFRPPSYLGRDRGKHEGRSTGRLRGLA